MRRFSVLALVILSLSAKWVAGAEPDAQESTSLPASEARPRNPSPSYRLITPAFQGALTKEQLDSLGPSASPEQLRDMMTPEQRGAARAALAAAEANAKTPEELKEIVRGYLILDEDGPQQGLNAIRLSETLQAANPQDSEGFALAASGYHQTGDYPAATEWAQRALELNPNDERARAVYALSKGRTKRGAGSAPGIKGTAASGPDGITAAGAEFTIPAKHDIAPEALSFVRQAIAARRRGDMAGAWSNVQAAMNADPKSLTVQKLFGMAKEDQAKHTDTLEFLRLSREALDAGHNEEAVAWARRAYERSGNPTVQKILDLTRKTADERSQQSAAKSTPATTPAKTERKGLNPLTTAAVMAGVLLLAWAATPQETKDHFKRALWDNPRQELKLAAIAGVVGLAAWQLGPPMLSAARAMLAASGPSAQGMQFATAGAGGGGAAVPALSWAETATAAVKAGAISILARAGFKKAAEQYTNASSNSAPQGGTGQGGRERDRLLQEAQDPELRASIDKLYRENARIGDGSSMDAFRYESQTGIKLSKSGHGLKLIERRTQLMRIRNKPGLSASDRQIVKDLLIKIQNALSGA